MVWASLSLPNQQFQKAQPQILYYEILCDFCYTNTPVPHKFIFTSKLYKNISILLFLLMKLVNTELNSSWGRSLEN